jgi:hypothetical protein
LGVISPDYKTALYNLKTVLIYSITFMLCVLGFYQGLMWRTMMLRHGETAYYIADMILELRNLAKGQNMQTLQGLLEIAYYEAYEVANPVAIPKDEAERLHELGKDARLAKVA